MALTRKMLAAMDIPAEKIDEIINAHMETVNPLKEERDALKAEADKAKTLEADLEKANKKLEDSQKNDFEKKYNDVKAEFDTFKADVEKKEVKVKKESAYRDLLKKAGVSDKRIETVMKVSASNIDALVFDGDKIKDADKIIEGVKTEWADFIGTVQQQGADTSTPPENTGGTDNKPTRAQELAAKYHENLYGKGKEN